jgi:uncharacterized protein YaaQ
MKLIIVFVQKEDSQKLLHALRQENLSVTAMESEGGFLQQKNITLLMALPEEKVDQAKKIIKDVCQSHTEQVDTSFAAGDIESVGLPTQVDIKVGGATILEMGVVEVTKI